MCFDTKKFSKRLKTSYMGRSLKYFDNIDSTNMQALRIFHKKDIESGSLLVAKKQHNGIGRFGREWLSPQGGLWFTLLVKKDKKIKSIERVNLIMANSIVYALEKNTECRFMVKWPNDIYLNGLKIGGILSEHVFSRQVSALIVGVGLNINNSRDTLGRYTGTATSLFTETKKNLRIEILLADILNCFEKDFEHFTDTGDMQATIRYIEDRFLL